MRVWPNYKRRRDVKLSPTPKPKGMTPNIIRALREKKAWTQEHLGQRRYRVLDLEGHEWCFASLVE